MTREEILQKSLELFKKISFSKTAVADIAKACGIGKGTVYLYFKTKDEIFFALVSDKLNHIISDNIKLYQDPNFNIFEKLKKIQNKLIDLIFETKDLLFGSFENFEGKVLRDVFMLFENSYSIIGEVLITMVKQAGYQHSASDEELLIAIKEYMDLILSRMILHLMRKDWHDYEGLKAIIDKIYIKLFKTIVLN